MEKLKVFIHSFYFSNGVWVKWTPLKNDGKAHGLFNVYIHFSDTDIERSQHHGPPSAAASLHLLKWAIKDRKKKG